VFRRIRHWSLSWARWSQFIPPHHISVRPILIFSHPRLGPSSGLFPSGFTTETVYAFFFSPMFTTRHANSVSVTFAKCPRIHIRQDYKAVICTGGHKVSSCVLWIKLPSKPILQWCQSLWKSKSLCRTFNIRFYRNTFSSRNIWTDRQTDRRHQFKHVVQGRHENWLEGRSR
jgi:hypothetical protein